MPSKADYAVFDSASPVATPLLFFQLCHCKYTTFMISCAIVRHSAIFAGYSAVQGRSKGAAVAVEYLLLQQIACKQGLSFKGLSRRLDWQLLSIVQKLSCSELTSAQIQCLSHSAATTSVAETSSCGSATKIVRTLGQPFKHRHSCHQASHSKTKHAFVHCAP